MPRARILLTGGSGLLALNWACATRETFEVVLATHTRRVSLPGTESADVPLDDVAALTGALRAIKPEIVVHTAGLTSVDACEQEPERARTAHVELTRNVCRASAAINATLVHVSTDHLYAGTRSLYTETDPPDPINVYGRTKLEAEHVVAEERPDALVLRTNFFGWGHRYRQSFSDWIYYSLAAGKPLTMFDDVFITPIIADKLATFAHRLIDAGASGTYNVVGDERISKYDFGVRLAEAFSLPKSLILRGKIAPSQLTAKRPPDMSLDNGKAQSRLGTPLGTLAEHLSLLRRQLPARRDELAAAVTE